MPLIAEAKGTGEYEHERKDSATEMLADCFDSVHIVQEVCRRCIRNEGIYQTQDQLTDVGQSADVAKLVRDVVDEQGGRYNGFIMNFPTAFNKPIWKCQSGSYMPY